MNPHSRQFQSFCQVGQCILLHEYGLKQAICVEISMAYITVDLALSFLVGFDGQLRVTQYV